MPVRIKITGKLACFTRPEMKVERVSYDVITPSAARGVLEAVYWKPQIKWVIDRVHVLAPIRFTNLRRNEVGTKVVTAGRDGVTAAMNSGTGTLGLYVEEKRQQRAATLLRDVSYVVEAHFEIVEEGEHPGKHLDQFNRRARKGQHFHQPYLGCREFPADVELIEEGDELPEPSVAAARELSGEVDLGYMLYDIRYTPDEQGTVVARHRAGEHQRLSAQPCFFRAQMVDGMIDVASLVQAQGVVA